MSEKIVQLNEEVIKGQIKELVRGSVEETLNELLEKEAESLTQAARYERSEARQGYRSGHYDRNLTTTSGDVTLHVPRLKGTHQIVFRRSMYVAKNTGWSDSYFAQKGIALLGKYKRTPPLYGGVLLYLYRLLDADGLDLHQSALGQRSDLHSGAGGILTLGKELGVHRVHGGEIAHILQEHGGLDHVVHGQAGGLQNGLDIGQHLAGLLGDAAGNKLAGGGVKGHLAGRDQEAAAVDGLGIGTDGGGGIGGGNDLLHGDDLL